MTDTDIHAPATSSFRLVVFSESNVRTLPLSGVRWTIGRAEDCDICLRDPTVSRRQIQLERFADEFRFQSLSSTNPVLLNGRPANQGVLPVGGTLTIGLTRLTLDRRSNLARVTDDSQHTVLLSREVLDDDAPTTVRPRELADITAEDLTCVLSALNWPLAEMGNLEDAAEPLLDLCLNLCGRRRGMLGTFQPSGAFRCLASLDRTDNRRELRVAEHLLHEARASGRPFLVTNRPRGEGVERLLIPFGPGPGGIILLEEPRRGAPAGQDLLRLSVAMATLVWSRLHNVEERLRLRDELSRARFAGTPAHDAVLVCSRLQAPRRQVRESAHLTLPVQIAGEEGTEKEDLARLLHASGPNSGGPFVPVYCTLLAAHRVEEELFGNSRLQDGGALARAHGGTLYLDRPNHLEPHVQERLFRTLREGRIEVGDHAIPVRVRLVTSLQVDPDPDAPPAPVLIPALAELLTALRLDIPPLREEPRDVAALADLFLAQMGPGPDGMPRTMTERAKGLLSAYSWPGNTRELRVVLEAAAAKAGVKPIAPRHLPDEVQNPNDTDPRTLPTLEDVERLHIRTVLARVAGNRSRASQVLGIATSTLYEKLKRFKLER